MVLPVTIPRGQTLADYRARLALTQAELAERAGCSRYTITKVEAGVLAPRPRTRRQIAAALGVEPGRIAWPWRLAAQVARPSDGA